MELIEPGSRPQDILPPVKPPLWRSVGVILKRRWLFVVGVVLGLWFVAEMFTLPFGSIVRLKRESPGETAFMREHAERAKASGRKFRVSQQWVPLSQIPQDVVDAVVVAEDGQFWSHGGFDWFEFKESVERNITEGRAARGASTITQQLVKNLYLSPSKNPLRKMREWVLTWWMEKNLTKRRILEIYLNVIEWGRGIYGIEAASKAYFGKSVQDLTPEESMRLAAVIPNPTGHGANEESDYMERRTAIIRNRMAARGMLKDSAVVLQKDSLDEMLKDSVDGLQRY